MLSKRGTERLAGTLLVVGFLFFLGHVATVLILGADLATLVFLLLYGFSISPAGLVLYRTFRAHDPTLALLAAFGFASAPGWSSTRRGQGSRAAPEVPLRIRTLGDRSFNRAARFELSIL